MYASWRGAIAAGVLAVVIIGTLFIAFQIDHHVRDSVVAAQGRNWKKTDEYRFFAAVRRYGDWPWLMLLGIIGFCTAWQLRKRDWMRIFAAAMIASTLTGLAANCSRLMTGRTRPRESPKFEQGFYGPWREGALTVGDSRFNSFPSGHTATAFGFALIFLFARPWLGVGAVLLAALIAFSSVLVGAHHPSDVAVSIVLSLLISFLTWRWVNNHGRSFAEKIWRISKDVLLKLRKR